MKPRQIFIYLGLVCCVGLMGVNTGYGQDVGGQFLIGFTSLDDDEIDFKDMEGLEDLDLDSDLSDLISIGGAGYHNLTGDKISLGVEYGGILSGMVDDGNAIARNGHARVSFDNALFLLDLFVGPQVNAFIGKRIRLYCGAGPLLMIGYVSADFKEREIEEKYDIDLSESDTSLGVGGYARLGAEFVLGKRSSLGLGVRGFTASLDFDDTLGDVDFEGVQGFFTYTARF
jgi:hypothetical protein